MSWLFGSVVAVMLASVGIARAQTGDAPSAARDAFDGRGALALWSVAPDDVWAVGWAGRVLHWNGTTWSRRDPQARANFTAIWGRGAKDIWIAGQVPTSNQAAAFHWDGGAWSDARFTGTRPSLIGASDDGAVWIASQEGSVWTWDGTAWRARVTAECKLPAGVDGGGCEWPRFHTSGGGAFLQPPPWRGYWDGSAFVRRRTLPSPVGRTFGGARSSSILLEAGPPSGPSWSEVRRWNGSRWVPLGTRTGPAWTPRGLKRKVTLRALWGASDEDVWAVGTEGTIVRWNGTTWSAFDAGTRSDLKHIGGTGPDDIWVTGGGEEEGVGPSPSVVLHWNGARWEDVTGVVREAVERRP